MMIRAITIAPTIIPDGRPSTMTCCGKSVGSSVGVGVRAFNWMSADDEELVGLTGKRKPVKKMPIRIKKTSASSMRAVEETFLGVVISSTPIIPC